MLREKLNPSKVLGMGALAVYVTMSVVTISCSSNRSVTFSENTASPASAAMFEAYTQNSNSADFATLLNRELDRSDLSPRGELPQSGQIAGKNFPDLSLRMEKMIAGSASGPKLKSNLRSFFRSGGVLGLRLTIDDFQLAESYIGAKLDAVNSPAAEAELNAKFPPNQTIRALYTITMIRALNRHNDKSASLALGVKATVKATVDLNVAATIAAISGAFNSGITCDSMVKPCGDAQKNYIKNIGKFNDNVTDINVCLSRTREQCTWARNGQDLSFQDDSCKKYQLWKCECKSESNGHEPADPASAAGCEAVQIISESRQVDRTAVDAACVAIKECATGTK